MWLETLVLCFTALFTIKSDHGFHYFPKNVWYNWVVQFSPKKCTHYHTQVVSLGTIKTSQVVVLNKDSVVVTQRKLMKTACTSPSNWIWLRCETYTLKVVFVEHHIHFNVYVSQQSQIHFEDKDHAIYMSFRWVTTTCLRWEPQPVTLWLYPVGITESVCVSDGEALVSQSGLVCPYIMFVD